MVGADRLRMAVSKCTMDKLRHQQRILRGGIARLPKAAREAFQVESPPHLQETIHLLESKHVTMYETDHKMIDLSTAPN